MAVTNTIQRGMVIDSVAPYRDQRGTSRLVINCVAAPITPGTPSVTPMPGITLNIDDPTEQNLSDWVPGATVQVNYVVQPPSKSGS